MSSLHLAKGALQPPKVDGKLRLYSMNFCPFAQRTRIVLLAKGVPHDIVNINLFDKPEWLFKLNPRGLIPILDTGSELLSESIEICEYLDKKYPNPPLRWEDEAPNEEDKQITEDFGKVLIPKFFDAALKKFEDKTLQECINEMLPSLQKLEATLHKRGTFFGGDQPKLLDYLLWPWAERAETLEFVFEEKLPVDEKTLPCIFNWCKEMRKQEPIKQTVTSAERLHKFGLMYKPGTPINYEAI